MTAWHSARVTRTDHPSAAWLAEFWVENEDCESSAWRSERAAKAWVRSRLSEQFGIDRKRLPWKRVDYGFALEWMTRGLWDDDSMIGWGCEG